MVPKPGEIYRATLAGEPDPANPIPAPRAGRMLPRLIILLGGCSAFVLLYIGGVRYDSWARHRETVALLSRAESPAIDPFALQIEWVARSHRIDRVAVFQALWNEGRAPAFDNFWSYRGLDARVYDAVCILIAASDPPRIFPAEVAPPLRHELLDAWRHHAWHSFLTEEDRRDCAARGMATPCPTDACRSWRTPSTLWIQRYSDGRRFGDPATIDPTW